MTEGEDRFDDGLGPDPLDRGSAKEMGGGGGGGSFYDLSYEDALRIMGRAHEIPSPFEQRARIMDNAEAAELARRLTLLRQTSGAGVGLPTHLSTLGLAGGSQEAGQAVEAFIAALQEIPADGAKLSALCQKIDEAGGEVRDTLALVCEHSTVQIKLGG